MSAPRRALGASLGLALALVAGAARAQDASGAPDPLAVDAAQADYLEVEGLFRRLGETPAAARGPVLDDLYAACGRFLDRHLAVARPEQLSLVGATWLRLAERAKDEAALEKRLLAFRGIPNLPPDLARLIELHAARLQVKVGAVAPSFEAPVVDRPAAERPAGQPPAGQPPADQPPAGQPPAGQTPAEGAAPAARLTLPVPEKLVLLCFWSSQNPSCEAFCTRKLRPLWERHGARPGLLVVGVGVLLRDETPATHAAAATARKLPWTLVRDEGQRASAAYGAATLPFLCLVGPDGKVLAVGPAWQVCDSIGRMLDERFAPPPAPPQDE